MTGSNWDRRERAKAKVLHLVSRMKPGQYVDIDAWEFQDAYPSGWPSIYPSAREAFLSSQVGSGWGSVTCERHPKGHYTIGIHEPGDKRVYVDPDREDWFTKLPNGEYVPRAQAAPPSPSPSPENG